MVYDWCFEIREDDNKRMRKNVNGVKKTENMNTERKKIIFDARLMSYGGELKKSLAAG